MLARIFSQSTAWPLGRGFASKAAASAPGLIEIREYTLKPEGVSQFMKVATEYADVRRELLPFLGLFTCDVGSCLHRVTHLYAYSSFEQRDEVRAHAAQDARWKKFIELSRPHVQYQENRVMLEARPIYEALELPPTALFSSPPTAGPAKVVYEMRSYQLHPGYGSVPKLVEAFSAGEAFMLVGWVDGHYVQPRNWSTKKPCWKATRLALEEARVILCCRFHAMRLRLSEAQAAIRRRCGTDAPSALYRLPAKVAADPEGRLVFFGYTDVGMLNNVVEIWRYPSAQACIK
ncbi:hypothetical protein VOLCADRAFT_107330 [Volvox carteri f. nagariensis]|uniref:NIPSNAP domain-containing protein n=1 Tax=Volvox carteri f. nagariensis TaxID=3068 RepID=D8UDC4_VOLCA|nr:uncharacterized protein VOLCADRAFT_107330 [Volvox carteri f. nagariensis]EFJ42285.1 hypothetical protein VOLCADRAFT_107330 [Volvox carteri f. nagariensis]|eukprot:XP_002956683.1 hypothetical protein VOLCADRAFT_107330 [Volvox carteri f. nagariensis]